MVNKKEISNLIMMITFFLIIVLFIWEVHIENQRQVKILTNHLEGLEMELEFSSDAIVQIRDKVEFGTLTAKPITISLYKILGLGTMRNETIRNQSLTVLFHINEISNTLDYINSIPEGESKTKLNKQIKNVIINNKIKERIEELKTLSISYKECIIKESNFNKC